MYRQCPTHPIFVKPQSVIRLINGACIPFDPANTDYQNFKYEILADQAELQNADGETMSPEAAKDFVRTLP